MHDLTRFTLSDMITCSSALRGLGAGATSMEEVANRIVRYLYDDLIDMPSGARACALVRFYKTHPYQGLDPELRGVARALLGDQPVSPSMKCLTLLATAGEQPEWNARRRSVGHKVIPLPSEQIVVQFPMVAQLVKQFGMEISTVLDPDPRLLVDLDQQTYNVFYVAEATGSPYVPVQAEFVIPCGIRSVLGFGGMLPSGDLMAIIMFAKVPIPRETADLFKTLALSTKVAVLPFVNSPVFSDAVN